MLARLFEQLIYFVVVVLTFVITGYLFWGVFTGGLPSSFNAPGSRDSAALLIVVPVYYSILAIGALVTGSAIMWSLVKIVQVFLPGWSPPERE